MIDAFLNNDETAFEIRPLITGVVPQKQIIKQLRPAHQSDVG